MLDINIRLFYYLFLIFISYFINNLYINRVEEVFLSGEDLRLIIWTLLIVFMYKFIVENDVLKIKKAAPDAESEKSAKDTAK